MTDRDVPWWAEEDPAGHASAGHRSGDGAGDARDAREPRGGGQEAYDRPNWSDIVRLIDVAVRTATQAARRTAQATGPSATRAPGAWDGLDHDHHDHHDDHDRHDAADVCTVCPVCTLLRTLDGSNPDAVAHLLEAARHTTLAVKAVIDAQASRFGGGDDFEQIRVDE